MLKSKAIVSNSDGSKSTDVSYRTGGDGNCSISSIFTHSFALVSYVLSYFDNFPATQSKQGIIQRGFQTF